MLLKQSRCHRVLAWAVLVASGTRFGIYVPVKSPIIKWRTKEKDHGNCSGMVQPEKKKKTGSNFFCDQTPEGSMKLVQTSYDKNHQHQKNGTVMSETLPQSRFVCSSVSVSNVTSFKGWLEYPDGVCDCLDSTEDKPSLGNGCAKLHSATRWERAAGVCMGVGACVCTALCVQFVCADIENLISTTVNVLLPIFPLTLSLTFISLFLCLIRLFSFLLL